MWLQAVLLGQLLLYFSITWIMHVLGWALMQLDAVRLVDGSLQDYLMFTVKHCQLMGS